ncbi:hypothetical protein DXG03_004107 [Asterophora parasitica]|uniref:Uncharacterized protein n=1 Tax=Asterophora parasitica TaxID=117018 RepID=A0A9P7K959_9AGAR|nr:hypothetical protein DXG03_004107 [Asterophora parasitica]
MAPGELRYIMTDHSHQYSPVKSRRAPSPAKSRMSTSTRSRAPSVDMSCKSIPMSVWVPPYVPFKSAPEGYTFEAVKDSEQVLLRTMPEKLRRIVKNPGFKAQFTIDLPGYNHLGLKYDFTFEQGDITIGQMAKQIAQIYFFWFQNGNYETQFQAVDGHRSPMEDVDHLSDEEILELKKDGSQFDLPYGNVVRLTPSSTVAKP